MEWQITAEEEERPTRAGSRARVRQRTNERVRQRTNEQTTWSENACVIEQTRPCVRERVRQQHGVLAEGREREKKSMYFFMLKHMCVV